jgi:hypothetical protein
MKYRHVHKENYQISNNTLYCRSASSGKLFFIRTRKMGIFDMKVKLWRLLSLTQWFCIVISAVICACTYICMYILQWPIEPNCYGGWTVQLFFYTAFTMYMSAFCGFASVSARSSFQKLAEIHIKGAVSWASILKGTNSYYLEMMWPAYKVPVPAPESQCPY